MSDLCPDGKDFNLREPNSNDFCPERAPEPIPYVSIYESELSNIAGQAAEAGFVETGGEAYGLLTHGGRIVVMFATGAGPKSIKKYSLFQQDHKFVKKSSKYIFENFGLQIVSGQHSHHGIPHYNLSKQDILRNYFFTVRNAYQKFCEFLITFENKIFSKSYFNNLRSCCGTNNTATQKEKNKRTSNLRDLDLDCGDLVDELHQPIYVRVHAFMFWNADKGQPPIRCPIRIIPGVSPIREAIIKKCPIPELKQSYNFPLNHILYDRYESETRSDLKVKQGLPKRIYSQCLQLPENIRNSSTVIYRENLTMLSLPVPGRGSIFLIFRNNKKHRVAAVYFTDIKANSEKVPLTDTVLRYGPYTNVKTIYKTSVRFLSLENNM